VEERELFIAKTQRNVSYLFLVGFFALLILQGLGLLKSLPMELLTQALLLVLFFWFQRERADKKPLEPKPPAEPEAPR